MHGGARSVGRLRQLVEPRMQIVERIAIAALALLDPLDEPAEQALDRSLIHRTLVGRSAMFGAAAGLPTSFRSHPIPHGVKPLIVRVRMVEGPVRETRDEAVETHGGKVE